MQLTKELLRASLAAAARRPCILCSRRACFAAVWVPSAEFQSKVDAPVGKTRFIFYSLCEKCVRRNSPERLADRVERSLLRDMHPAGQCRQPEKN